MPASRLPRLKVWWRPTTRFQNLAGPAPDALAEAELRLTHTVLTYVRHLQAGRFPYNRVTSNIELAQQPPDNAEVLTRIADARGCRRGARSLQSAA